MDSLAYLGGKSGSRQTVSSPPELVEWVRAHWDVVCDLAATKDDAVVPVFVGPEEDSLTVDWSKLTGDKDEKCDSGSNFGWLNPPYKNVGTWIKKCHEETLRGARAISLTPASVGSRWFSDWVVDGPCWVLFLTGRLRFPGYKNCSGHDSMLVIWDGQPWREPHWIDWESTSLERQAYR